MQLVQAKESIIRYETDLEKAKKVHRFHPFSVHFLFCSSETFMQRQDKEFDCIHIKKFTHQLSGFLEPVGN